MAAPTSTALDALPFEALLEIASAVGALSPVCRQPGQNDIINLSSTSSIMRSACQKLLFRGIVVNFADLEPLVGRLDPLFSRPANQAREIMQGFTQDIRWTRSFALTLPAHPQIRAQVQYRQMVDRAGIVLSHVISHAQRLRKLTVVLPTVQADLQSAFDIPAAFNLPLVEELVIDPLSEFLLGYCPNVTRLTLTQFATLPGPTTDELRDLITRAANLPNLRSLEVNTVSSSMMRNFPQMDRVERLTIVGMLRGSVRTELLHLASTLPNRMPNLRSITVVVPGPRHGSIAAWRAFQRPAVARRWIQEFFDNHNGLEEVQVACITHGNQIHYPVNPPTLLSCFKAQRHQGNPTESFTLQRQSELDLGAFSYRDWRPSFEGPP